MKEAASSACFLISLILLFLSDSSSDCSDKTLLALLVIPVKTRVKFSENLLDNPSETSMGSTWTPFSPNLIELTPPKEAAYWSCLPIGAPKVSISIWQASSASCSLEASLPWKAYIAFSRPTVTEEEDPSPVPCPGMSAIVVISTPDSIPVSLNASLTRPC